MIAHADVSGIHERNNEMRREVAANRMARRMRANRGMPDLAHGLRWELARYAGRISKRLRHLG